MTTVPTPRWHDHMSVSAKNDEFVASFGPYDIHDYNGARRLYTVVWGADEDKCFILDMQSLDQEIDWLLRRAPEKEYIWAVIAFMRMEGKRA